MLVPVHIILSAILSLILVPIFGIYSLLIFLGGVLIDVDHYLEYAVRKKDLSLIKAYKEGMMFYRKSIRLGRPIRINVLHIFHTLEFLIIFMLLSFFSKIISILLIGILFHIVLDLGWLIKRKALKSRAHSFIGWLEK